jgi:hypothetical protein
MHRPLIATSFLVAGTLAVGFAFTHTGGATPSFAAGGKHKLSTTKKHKASSTVHKTSAAQSSTQHADGTVTAINGDTITVKADADRAGSTEYTSVTTINLTGTTKYSAGHDSAATTTRPTISVGQYIIAEGTVSSDGKTLTASQVSVGAGGPGHGGPGFDGPGHDSGPHADGTVSAVNGDTITVTADTDPAGSTEYTKVTTIVLTSSTQYDAGRDSAATTTKPTITAGEHIVAEGTLSSDGTTLTATQVSVETGGPGGH